jgi:hypothetical protein
MAQVSTPPTFDVRPQIILPPISLHPCHPCAWSVPSGGCYAPWSTYKVKGGVIVNVADKVKGRVKVKVKVKVKVRQRQRTSTS